MPKITIVGLGPWEKGHLTEQAITALAAGCVVLRTGRHPAAADLRAKDICFTTLDFLYHEAEDFSDLNAKAASEVTRLALERGAVAYCVPGQGMAGDSTVAELLANYKEFEYGFIPGIDETAGLIAQAAIQFGINTEAYAVIPAMLLDSTRPDRKLPLVITQIDSKLTAGDVKLRLSKLYGDEAQVILSLKGKCEMTTLAELDRQNGYDHRAMALLPPAAEGSARYDLYDIVSIMDKLRGPSGCPWDREQTHESLKQYLLEETYEVFEAIDREDMGELCDELGDVLLQVVFHSRMAQERGDFDITDVSNAISRKMILRHPHIFGDVSANSSEQVLFNWEAIKKKEKGQNTETGMMKQIPIALPALMRSMKVQGKAARMGFDWEDVWGAYEKLEEEVGELKEAIASGSGEEKLSEELGDVLFATINVARFIKVHPEFALTSTVEKFIRRFEFIERQSALDGKTLDGMTLSEMDEYWNKAKSNGL